MTTRSLLRPKDKGDGPGPLRNPEPISNESSELGSESEYKTPFSELTDDTELDDRLRRFCLKRFENCCLEDKVHSSTDSDRSYVPFVLKKLKKRFRLPSSSNTRKKLKSRSINNKNRDKLDTHSANKTSRSEFEDKVKIAARSKIRAPSKEETIFQKSANIKTDSDGGGSRQGSKLVTSSFRGQLLPTPETRSKARKSIVDILLDPNVDQKEAERMVVEMHRIAKESRINEVEGYLDEVKKAIQKLDVEDGALDVDDADYVDLTTDLDEADGEAKESDKMDSQAMRIMLTALAGREAKEDAVASVANVGAGWRTIPHDQLNCCLSMDPKLMGEHRRRVKNNYEEFDRVFRRRKGRGVKNDHAEEENEIENAHTSELEQEKSKAEDTPEKEEEPVNLAELTREEMLEIHDKIGPWVHHHTKKLDRFIQSKKYTPQYLLNHWNGELSDDDSEVDFEKHRSAWKKKLEGENPGEANQEGQPQTVTPEDRVPTLQDNNWFLFPTPLTRSLSMETDEQGWDGQRTRPFSQLAMEGLVKHLKRQQLVEKSKKFLKDNPWPPPSRYPPEVKPEVEIKYVGSGMPDEEEEEDDIK